MALTNCGAVAKNEECSVSDVKGGARPGRKAVSKYGRRSGMWCDKSYLPVAMRPGGGGVGGATSTSDTSLKLNEHNQCGIKHTAEEQQFYAFQSLFEVGRLIYGRHKLALRHPVFHTTETRRRLAGRGAGKNEYHNK